MCVSCQQHALGSCFFTQSDDPCLLFGAFDHLHLAQLLIWWVSVILCVFSLTHLFSVPVSLLSIRYDLPVCFAGLLALTPSFTFGVTLETVAPSLVHHGPHWWCSMCREGLLASYPLPPSLLHAYCHVLHLQYVPNSKSIMNIFVLNS